MSLLADVIVAHGGEARWQEVRGLELDLRVGGNILALRMVSPRIRHLRCTVLTDRVYAVLNPYPELGAVGVFDNGRVTVRNADGTIRSRVGARDLDGQVHRRWIWDDLDTLYFLGYSLWNYATLPFVLMWRGFEVSEGGVWRGAPTGGAWRRLHLSYPRGFHTHSRAQTIYCDQTGWIRRLDYTAEVFSARARAAHYCGRHTWFGGLLFPTHRVVFYRTASGKSRRCISLMEGWVDHVTLLDRTEHDAARES
jgi:hypothetical protein